VSDRTLQYSQAAYEYPAYALQIESLAPDVGTQFLSTFDQEGIRRASLFSDSMDCLRPQRSELAFRARSGHSLPLQLIERGHLDRCLVAQENDHKLSVTSMRGIITELAKRNLA
jgi:hypothetical protein